MMSAKEVAEYRKKQKEGRSGGGKNWLKTLKPGTYYFRIAKPWKADGDFWKDVVIHGKWKTKVYCGKNTVRADGSPGKCAVCRRLKKLRDEPRTKMSKILFGLLINNEEYLWNVTFAKVKTLDSGKVIVKGYEDNQFKIWRLSKTWHLELVEIFADEEYRAESVLGVTDPKKGFLIRVKREGEGRDDTEYKFKVVGEASPLLKDKEGRVALNKTINNLDEVVKASSEEELSAFVHMMEKKAKRLSKSEDDDADEDEEDSDNDSDIDDDDEPKKKKKSKKSKASEDDDEDDDADEEEDDNDDNDEESDEDEEEDDDE